MELIAVFRAPNRRACEERAFVLQAMGIGSEVASDGGDWVIAVSSSEAAAALAQLQRYEWENPPRRVVSSHPGETHRWAWAVSAGYVGVMLLIGYLAGRKAFGCDWMAAGAAEAAAMRAGEWWRAVTALTLHFDVGHLLANLGFGAVFMLFAGQLLGPGVAALGVLEAAGLANLLCVLLEPSSHISVGASTAVFATLGVLSAYAWRRRANDGERWTYRWAPLFAGVCLLAFTGAGGENTDVLAHLLGFGSGALTGAALAQSPRRLGRGMQWLAGIASVGAVTLAWACALASGLGH